MYLVVKSDSAVRFQHLLNEQAEDGYEVVAFSTAGIDSRVTYSAIMAKPDRIVIQK
jgi:hypothetical protein